MEIIYTLEQMCEILQVHYQTVLKLLRSRKLQGFKMGREWRITKRDLEIYIQQEKDKLNNANKGE